MDTRPLPPGWISQIDPQSNRTYYVNTNTGETSWEDPRPEYYAREGNSQHLNSNSSALPPTLPTFPDYNSAVNSPSTQAPLGFSMPGGPEPGYNNRPLSMPGTNGEYNSGMPNDEKYSIGIPGMPSADDQSFGMPSSKSDGGYNGSLSNNYPGYPTASEYSNTNSFSIQSPGVMQNDTTNSGYLGTSSTYTSGEPNYEKSQCGNNNVNTPQIPGSADPVPGDQERFLGLSKPSLMGAVVGGLAGKIASSKLSSGASPSQPQQNYYGGQQPQGQYYGVPPQGQYYGGPPPQGQYGAPPYPQGKPPKESGLGSVGSVLAGGLGGMALGMVANKLMGGKHHHGGKH